MIWVVTAICRIGDAVAIVPPDTTGPWPWASTTGVASAIIATSRARRVAAKRIGVVGIIAAVSRISDAVAIVPPHTTGPWPWASTTLIMSGINSARGLLERPSGIGNQSSNFWVIYRKLKSVMILHIRIIINLLTKNHIAWCRRFWFKESLYCLED